jgi:hypothetical protein
MRGFLALLVIMIALAIVVDGKGMWGSRKKKEREEDSDSIASASIDLAGDVRKSRPGKSQRMAAPNPIAEAASEVENTILMYLDLAGQYLEGDEFDQYITPDAIQNMINMIPADALENADVAAFINSPELLNPDVLKMSMREGLKGLRVYAAQIAQVINAGPEAMDEMISQLIPGLPTETRQMYLNLMNGDTSQLAAMVDGIEGIDPAQKAMFKGLLSGETYDPASIQKMFQAQISQVMGDSNQLEETRRQFLASPETAYALGITEEQLSDPEKWAELMEDGMKSLEGIFAEDSSEDTIRKFAASGAA